MWFSVVMQRRKHNNTTIIVIMGMQRFSLFCLQHVTHMLSVSIVDSTIYSTVLRSRVLHVFWNQKTALLHLAFHAFGI